LKKFVSLIYGGLSSCKLSLILLVRIVFFTIGTDFGYGIFIIANYKFTDVLVTALIKSHVPEPCVGKSDGRLKKYHATTSPILRCLR